MEKRFYETTNKILRILATNIDARGKLEPMNKHQIQEKADIQGRQTTLNAVKWLKERQLLICKTKEWRRNRKAKYYTLNDMGLWWTAKRIPELEETIKKHLGRKYEELEQKHRRTPEFMKHCVGHLQRTIEGPLPPKHHWILYMKTDSQGRTSGLFWEGEDPPPSTIGCEACGIRIGTKPRPWADEHSSQHSARTPKPERSQQLHRKSNANNHPTLR